MRDDSSAGGRVRERRRKSFYTADNVIYDTFGGEIGPYALAVYHYLCRRANDDERSWPKIRTIQSVTKLSPSSVRRAIEDLERAQLISVAETFDEEGQAENVYTLLEPPTELPANWKEGPRPERLKIDYRGTPDADRRRRRHPIAAIKQRINSAPPLSEGEGYPEREKSRRGGISETGGDYQTASGPLSESTSPPVSHGGVNQGGTKLNEENVMNKARSRAVPNNDVRTPDADAATIKLINQLVGQQLWGSRNSGAGESIVIPHVQKFTKNQIRTISNLAKTSGAYRRSAAALLKAIDRDQALGIDHVERNEKGEAI